MAYLLALLADFANGLFAILFAGWITNTELAWWHLPVGILLAMCPDLDALRELISRGKVSASIEHGHDHREGLHYPTLFLAGGAIAAGFVPYWGTVFLIAVTLHFVNDFYGTGWGIKLLWPFSKRNYKLLGRRANLLKRILKERGQWDAVPPEERTLRLIVSWSPDELPAYIRRFGLDEWIEPYYLRLNWISGIEYTLFLIAAVLTAITLIH